MLSFPYTKGKGKAVTLVYSSKNCVGHQEKEENCMQLSHVSLETGCVLDCNNSTLLLFHFQCLCKVYVDLSFFLCSTNGGSIDRLLIDGSIKMLCKHDYFLFYA